MTLLHDVRTGAQTPQVSHLPPGRVSSAGQEAIDLAASVGLHLDPWQQWVLDHALAEDASGRWCAFEVGLVVPRQNGKNAILEALELAAIYLFGEMLVVHSAHKFDTSQEHFLRLQTLIEGSDDLSRKLARNGFVTATGKDVLEAQQKAYAAVDQIDFPDGFCRRDIGWRAVARLREGAGR